MTIMGIISKTGNEQIDDRTETISATGSRADSICHCITKMSKDSGSSADQ
jgi:hypothetical protein